MNDFNATTEGCDWDGKEACDCTTDYLTFLSQQIEERVREEDWEGVLELAKEIRERALENLYWQHKSDDRPFDHEELYS